MRPEAESSVEHPFFSPRSKGEGTENTVFANYRTPLEDLLYWSVKWNLFTFGSNSLLKRDIISAEHTGKRKIITSFHSVRRIFSNRYYLYFNIKRLAKEG